MTQLLQAEPDLVGLNSNGAANPGIQAPLERNGRAAGIVWICHELTPHARQALLSGVADAVINQDAGHAVLHDQERIRIDIFLRDNMP